MPEASTRPSSTLDMPRLDTSTSYRDLAYAALKRAITAMDIYDHAQEIRLDERRLSQGLGVSRTPIREAMTLLEQEGFVRTLPRRGIYVVRKTKREIVEMITVWAALESMAARLVALNAPDGDIAELRRLMDAFHDGPDGQEGGERLEEYSDANIAFHQAIIRMSGCALLAELTENLFIHMRAIRKVTIQQDNRAARSIVDHMAMIEALERRDPELAERLAREHTLGLAAHVEKHGDFLDTTIVSVSPAEAGAQGERRNGGPGSPLRTAGPDGPFRGSRG
ncbi:MAG TPA: GntR family transcriptional regulator [Stellaceae bacterium]|nr:GntR family transcriptional regulator [Stellaceae bacterium]